MAELSRRELLGAGAALAVGLPGLPPLHWPPPGPQKLLDIGPNGVIEPGSAQDLRAADNLAYYLDTRSRWIRLWADWATIQPLADFAIDDPRNPGAFRLAALDDQIRLAKASGLKVVLVAYRFPPWVNGTAELAARQGSDAEIAFEPHERMTEGEWDRWRRAGGDPRRKELVYRLPDDPYGPSSEWARFFDFLYRRYGQAASPLRVDALELVNEPNLQLWPQQRPAPGGNPFAPGPRTIERTVAQLMATAQAVSARYGHATMLLAPSLSDGDTAPSRRFTRFEDFVPALLDALDAIGYVPHPQQAWSHHNYTDVEQRLADTRTQRLRGLLAGRWRGYAEDRPPTVFVTEGGARVSAMPERYPREAPRAAQARCLRLVWERHRDPEGAGAGVATLAQYLTYADPNFDCGLLDPFPSRVKRPAYEAWKEAY